jgi:ribosomal protein L37AE/L43A
MPYKDPEIRKLKSREYTRKWRRTHPEWRERRKTMPSYSRRYSIKTPQAARAHRAVYMQVTRPDTCSRCKTKIFVEAAHTSYETGEYIWLCRGCHRKMDGSRKNGGMNKLIYKDLDGRCRR